MDPLPVTLIVKAPNQQFEDQTIKCEPTWSIRKLKGYLTEVYPCNPTLEEQKLIYSGQLLNDAQILKDFLRQYEGQETETHTVHLVYTPKNRPFTASTSTKSSQSSSKDNADNSQQAKQRSSQTSQQPSQQQGAAIGSDGLRHRNLNGGTTTSGTNQIPGAQPSFMTGFLNAPQPFMPGMSFAQPNNQTQPQYTPEQYAIAQQIAMQNMMNQMYFQYMNQYAAAMQQSNPTQTAAYFPTNYFPQSNFGLPQQFGPNGPNADQQTPQAQPEAQPVAQPPRFQVQAGAAAAAAAAAAAVDDEAENRDWLEILYTLSRLLVLLSLVYFYSSPGRCSIVIIVIVLYYFYQNHQRNIRDRQQLERLQEAAGEPDVIDGPLENNEQQNLNETDGQNNPRNEGESTPLIQSDSDNLSASLAPSNEQDENNRLPTITLLRTFILSFFSSLIPETPAV